ncbi:hypothetical protein K488DRAFT_74072 [Vararia minispora EC-137]|uniref:Uncharacterized protein n=1 Tax=Vararia minispora EC-137 TaxID=1314806 RepID=A0ACB8Q8Z0_9AGAM|nr:hypothetical protein K488DRAFT_74072 [Vararia minispora EC-137]
MKAVVAGKGKASCRRPRHGPGPRRAAAASVTIPANYHAHHAETSASLPSFTNQEPIHEKGVKIFFLFVIDYKQDPATSREERHTTQKSVYYYKTRNETVPRIAQSLWHLTTSNFHWSCSSYRTQLRISFLCAAYGSGSRSIFLSLVLVKFNLPVLFIVPPASSSVDRLLYTFALALDGTYTHDQLVPGSDSEQGRLNEKIRCPDTLEC